MDLYFEMVKSCSLLKHTWYDSKSVVYSTLALKSEERSLLEFLPIPLSDFQKLFQKASHNIPDFAYKPNFQSP